MAKIWEFFENLNEIVYVADMENYEMVYMNKKALEVYGFSSASEMQGRKCYEVLQGCSTPCAICCNDELREGYFKEWKYYNPILEMQLNLKDTLILDEGRRYRMEIALDNSLLEKRREILNQYQKLEAMANEGLRIALNASTPDMTLQIMMEHIGQSLKSERTYIFERNEKGNDDNTYEWVAKGVVPEKEYLQDIPGEVCEKWYRQFRINKSIVIKDVEEIHESDPLQYENLKQQGVSSVVVVPLYDDSEIIGFYGVDNPPLEKLEYISDMLQIAGHFIVSSLKRRNLVRKLKEMSHYDQLTKLGNRYAMNEYFESRRPGESIGVVYCDVTGLKWVNDNKGHEAGDRLILSACDCLKRVFGDYGVFRIGGDEMLVLCAGITEDELQKKVTALRADLQENSVNMAIGVIWQADGMTDADNLLTDSEKLMYEDKAEYYKRAGIDRRK